MFARKLFVKVEVWTYENKKIACHANRYWIFLIRPRIISSWVTNLEFFFIVMAKEQSKAPASSKAEQTVRSFSKQWVSERQSLYIVIAKYVDREIYLKRRNVCYCNDCFLIHSWIWWARFLRAHSRGIVSLHSDGLFILTLGLIHGKI